MRRSIRASVIGAIVSATGPASASDRADIYGDLPPATASMPSHVNRTRGNRRFGDHGVGHRRDGRRQRLRGGAAVPQPVDGGRHARRTREVAQPPGREGQADRGRAGRGPGPGHRHLRPRRPGRLRPGHRVGRRGPGRQEGALQRARPDHRRPRHPGHQHLDAPGDRDGHADRPARQGVRHPLLQPGADDGPGRGGPAADRVGRDHRRGPASSPRPAARRRSRSRTRPGSSSTPSSSPTSTTPSGCSSRGWPRSRTSTPP